MSPTVAAITIVIAVAALVLVLVLVRRQRLKERYAVIWLVVASGMVVLAVFRPLLDRLSDALGIQSGTTTVFLLAVLVILAVQLQLSMSLTSLEEKMRDLAEAVALGTDRWSADSIEPSDDREDERSVPGENAIDDG